MNSYRILVSLVAMALLWTLSACFEPDRAGYVEMAAEDFCEEAQRCDNLGGGGLYDSYSDCEIEMRSSFNSRWSESDCGGDRIDPDAYETCMRRALNYACSGSASDWLSYQDACRASQVCIN